MVLVDTSAWIHCLRPDGDPTLRARVTGHLHAGDAAWCPMIRLELWNGARGEHEKCVLRDMECHLIDLAITDDVWRDAFRMARANRVRGHTIPSTDLLIAACARHHGVALIHADRHFDLFAATR